MENAAFTCEIVPVEAEIRNALEQSRKYCSASPKEIRIRPGTCRLSSPIVLDERDAGLILRGSSQEETSLDCGMELSAWTRRADQLWECKLPDGAAEPRMLAHIDGGKLEIRKRSCYPVNGTLDNLDTTDVQWMSSQFGGWNRKPTLEELSKLTACPNDLPSSFSIQNAEITQFHVWDESTTLVKDYNPETGIVQFASPAEHPAGAFGRHGYVIRNLMAGMEVPGCWMFDRPARKLIYHPLPDEEELGPRNYRIPCLESAIQITGGNGITLENLTICGANGSLITPGLRAVNPPGAIYARNCTGLTLSKLRIYQCAGQGIKSFQCSDLKICGCNISDCGAGGILSMESMPSQIEGNSICRIGLMNFSAPAVTAGGKSLLVYVQDGSVPEEGTCIVRDNTIDNAPYCGICCCGGPHGILGNTISNAMLRLHDGGAIYVSRGYKTTIRNNKVYKLGKPEDSTCHAYYLDELSCDCVVADNIALECVSPFHAHKSVDCTLRGNRFFSSSCIKLSFLKCSNYHLVENVMMAMKRITFSNMNNHVLAEHRDELYSPEGPCEFTPTAWALPDFEFIRNQDNRADFIPYFNPATVKKWKRILFFGDSITHRGEYTKYLQIYCSCRFPDQEIEIINAGCGGETAGAGLVRIEKDVIARKPDVVFLAFGMNDAGISLYTGERLSPEHLALGEKLFKDFETNMELIQNRLLENNIDVAYMATVPYDQYGIQEGDFFKEADTHGIEVLIERLKNAPFRQGRSFVDIHTPLKNLYRQHPELIIAPDRVHPDTRGAALMADQLAAAIFWEKPDDEGTLPYPQLPGIPPEIPLPNLYALGKNTRIDTSILLEKAIAWQAAVATERNMMLGEMWARRHNADPDAISKADVPGIVVQTSEKYRKYFGGLIELYIDNKNRIDEIKATIANARNDYFQALKSLRSSIAK